jgi:hypothetical protein
LSLVASPEFVGESLVGGAISEGTCHVGVGGVGEFVSLLGELFRCNLGDSHYSSRYM